MGDLLPRESVEVWDGFTDSGGTFWYALLNRQRNYRAEVWKKTPAGAMSKVWNSDEKTTKSDGISISPLGRSIRIAWSHSSTPDSTTPFLPYEHVITDVLPQTNPPSAPANVTITSTVDKEARQAASAANATASKAISLFKALGIAENQSLKDWFADFLFDSHKATEWLYAKLQGYGLIPK